MKFIIPNFYVFLKFLHDLLIFFKKYIDKPIYKIYTQLNSMIKRVVIEIITASLDRVKAK